jgi:hypothetical protein
VHDLANDGETKAGAFARELADASLDEGLEETSVDEIGRADWVSKDEREDSDIT